MEYIAHKRKDEHKIKEEIQTIEEHLLGTAELAGAFARKFDKEAWGYCCGVLHDIGKYSKEFQHKIQENTNENVDHSTAGAQLCNELGRYYFPLSYCIAGHHAGLPDYGNTEISSSLCGRCKKRIYDYQAYKKEIVIPALSVDMIGMERDKDWNFAMSVLIRMRYSCLVDADYLDTESFMKNGDTGRESGEPMEALLEKLQNHISEWLSDSNINSINGRRSEILKSCLEAGKEREGILG